MLGDVMWCRPSHPITFHSIPSHSIPSHSIPTDGPHVPPSICLSTPQWADRTGCGSCGGTTTRTTTPSSLSSTRPTASASRCAFSFVLRGFLPTSLVLCQIVVSPPPVFTHPHVFCRRRSASCTICWRSPSCSTRSCWCVLVLPVVLLYLISSRLIFPCIVCHGFPLLVRPPLPAM